MRKLNLKDCCGIDSVARFSVRNTLVNRISIWKLDKIYLNTGGSLKGSISDVEIRVDYS